MKLFDSLSFLFIPIKLFQVRTIFVRFLLMDRFWDLRFIIQPMWKEMSGKNGLHRI